MIDPRPRDFSEGGGCGRDLSLAALLLLAVATVPGMLLAVFLV